MAIDGSNETLGFKLLKALESFNEGLRNQEYKCGTVACECGHAFVAEATSPRNCKHYAVLSCPACGKRHRVDLVADE